MLWRMHHWLSRRLHLLCLLEHPIGSLLSHRRLWNWWTSRLLISRFHVRYTDTPYLLSCLIVENPVDSLLMSRLWDQYFWRRLGLKQDSKTLLWSHRRWRRCVSLCIMLWTPCILRIRLYCRCILLGTHRLGGRRIWLRGHQLRSRCIKLCLDWCGKEIWMHTIPSHWIPLFGESRRRSFTTRF